MTGVVTPELNISIERFGQGDTAPNAVVAIPVKDEAERLPNCLQALAAQEGVDFGDIAVVLLLNNCTDGTADVVRAMAADSALSSGNASGGAGRRSR